MRQNTQPNESFVHQAIGSTVEIVGEPWHTIQGEGPFAGTPAIFVRLAGCNLQCPLCDTDYTHDRTHRAVYELCHQIKEMAVSTDLIVITGGEPFRQGIGEFVDRLIALRLRVQIETNGTLYRALDFRSPRLTIVCSPKAGKVHPKLEPHILAYKYVVADGQYDVGDGLPTSVLGMGHKAAAPPEGFPKSSIYIQPQDNGDIAQNARNTAAVVSICQRFGYRLCLQIQKLVGVP